MNAIVSKKTSTRGGNPLLICKCQEYFVPLQCPTRLIGQLRATCARTLTSPKKKVTDYHKVHLPTKGTINRLEGRKSCPKTGAKRNLRYQRGEGESYRAAPPFPSRFLSTRTCSSPYPQYRVLSVLISPSVSSN